MDKFYIDKPFGTSTWLHLIPLLKGTEEDKAELYKALSKKKRRHFPDLIKGDESWKKRHLLRSRRLNRQQDLS